MTTGFTAPRSRGRRSPVKPIGSTRPAAAAPAGEPTPSVDPTPTEPEHMPAAIETGAAATAPADPAPAAVAEPAPEPELPTTDPEPTPDTPQASTPAPEPTTAAPATPPQEQPRPTEPQPVQTKPLAAAPTPAPEQPVAPPAVQAKRDHQPTPLPSEALPTTSGHAAATTPLVVIWDGTVSYASSAVHVLDLDAAARADNAHDVLDVIAALKDAATDGPVEELVNTLFGILRSKV